MATNEESEEKKEKKKNLGKSELWSNMWNKMREKNDTTMSMHVSESTDHLAHLPDFKTE